jgi:MinD superfamily P-loop ATPase
MKIAIASGKGGTGKTTVAVNLFYYLSKIVENRVQLVDCDVEEPNDILFLSQLEQIKEKQVYSLVPKIDTTKCTFCKKCDEWCEFNAITIIKNLKFAEISKDLCHSCGACSMACNFNAIEEFEQPLGIISQFNANFGNGIVEGRLEIGSAMQTALIKEVKKYASQENDIILFDSPPGTSCPVVETVSDTDYVVLVTEPTPFGLNDLKITVELLIDLKIPFGVIVNKAGLGSYEMFQYLLENNIELLGEIPFSKKYASQYSKGDLLKDIPSEIELLYHKITEKLIRKFVNK